MQQPKVLVFDIETSPMLAYVWDLHEQNVALGQLHKDRFVIAWSAKWLGDPASKIMYMDQRGSKNIEDDRKILQGLWNLLDEADIVITQNGKSFDSRRLNARFITHGMKPPSPYRHIDTYLLIRSVADFTSKKLGYLADTLCTKYKKLKHSEFPGLSLWIQCMAGNRKAWDSMKKYNIHDVLSTEELYEKVKAWAPQQMPTAFIPMHVSVQCGTCGKQDKMQRRGFHLTKTHRVQRFQCKGCGAWQLGKKEKLHG